MHEAIQDIHSIYYSSLFLTTFLAAKTLSATVFINEFHYENDGSHLNEQLK